MKPSSNVFFLLSCYCVTTLATTTIATAELKVGAVAVNVTPVQMPVMVNGGMLGRTVGEVDTNLYARAIVIDDGHERIGMVVVDSCMMPRPYLDEVKQFAAQQTNIRPDRMLVSATHTHSAPSVFDCFATIEPTYLPYLRLKLAEAFTKAAANLEPAKVGWAVTDAKKFTALRRWIIRPDRVRNDIFGNPTVRATMHAGSNWDDVTGTSGPEDPDLSLISFQSLEGRPIAVWANFSMHYFGSGQGLSSDYFGLYCKELESHLDRQDNNNHPPFVAAMSHGCSGDIWRLDYALPPDLRYEPNIEEYSSNLVKLTLNAYRTIDHRDNVDVAMAETRLKMQYRVPNQQLLAWAQKLMEEKGDRPPKNSQESYAREQIALHQQQSTEIVVQALRIGDIAIATTPTETYALTGLKLKLQSPLPKTMVLDLTNGADGYIPPPEQHHLGGYNTWPMRGAGLEISAEPRITEAALGLLENVSGKLRRTSRQTQGPDFQSVLEAGPIAYWRLDELAGPLAIDSSTIPRNAWYEPGVVFFLKGPNSNGLCNDGEQNRAAHFAGGRLRTHLDNLGDRYSIAMWFWNGMPLQSRDIAGWMFSRGREYAAGPQGDHLGIGGTAHAGKLVFLSSRRGEPGKLAAGNTKLQRWDWHHVTLVRDGHTVRIYLNGNPQPEIEVSSTSDAILRLDHLFFGGRCDNQSNWEGRLDEVTVFNRALSADEIDNLYR